jgi:hypothetical protein
LFFGLLAVLACWPLGHLVLVDRYLVNPWELCGFAMYVQPNTLVEVRLFLSSGEVLSPEMLDQTAADALAEYRNRAGILGLLASPDELAQALRRSGHAPEELQIELRRQMIDSRGQLTYRKRMRRF